MSDWEEVNVPRGAYIGWGMRKGQFVEGEVLDYNPIGGTDFNDNVCPQLQVILTAPAASFNKAMERKNFEPNSLVVVNAGLVSLSRAVKAANLMKGDMVRIELTDILAGQGKNGGDVKEFGIKLKRGEGKLSTNAERALNSANAQQSGDNDFGQPSGNFSGDPEPSFAGSAPSTYVPDDEPPF